MKYHYIETPFGKSKVKHRFDSAEIHTVVDRVKTTDGQQYEIMADGHRVCSPRKRRGGKSARRRKIALRRDDRELDALLK